MLHLHNVAPPYTLKDDIICQESENTAVIDSYCYLYSKPDDSH